MDDKRKAAEELKQGLTHHRAGDVARARTHYEHASKLDPENPHAWHLLGVCDLQGNSLANAEKLFRTCIGIDPTFADAHNQLGIVLSRTGRHADAIHAFGDAMRAREYFAEAAFNAALSHQAIGESAEAERLLRQALAWRPSYWNAADALATVLRVGGRYDEALAMYRRAQLLRPDNAHANGALAQMLLDGGHANEASRYARAAIAIEPKQAHWRRMLGIAERLQRNTEAAIEALREAIALNPHDDGALCELGVALIEAGEIEEARSILARATPMPNDAERLRWTILLSLPSVYPNDESVDIERARYAQSLDTIARDLKLEMPQECRNAYDAVRNVTTFLLHYQPRDNTALQGRFGDLVDTVMKRAFPQFAQPCTRRAGDHVGRLRVGIVSSHLMHHTVSRYFRALLVGLNPSRFDVRVFYSGQVRDFSTDAIAERVSEFHFVNDDAISTAARIVEAKLDVLIFPEIGMDARHHVLGALRLAPIQCALYGHPVTSGLPNIDYFLSGDALEPENAQDHYREKLVLLPGLGTRPERPPEAGDGSWIDAFANGAPLLLCLQNHLKLVPSFDAVLARIVKRSGAKLGFFIRNISVARRFRERIENAFRDENLDPDRSIVFLPTQSHELYLGAIQRATLVLDSPWFSGGATSLDAFSVGAPVLAFEGPMARSRQTSGMLRMMGAQGLIAGNETDYVARAVALIADENARAELREQILRNNDCLFDKTDVVAAFSRFIEEVCGR